MIFGVLVEFIPTNTEAAPVTLKLSEKVLFITCLYVVPVFLNRATIQLFACKSSRTSVYRHIWVSWLLLT